ncbi:hypothetical protein [Pseudactinotalea suaedae]|uniref:hypothetical protein n=1 Tax=Pseudactinotalea suaedae TaxID=1524924 RepID=UPI0012E14733|nr:hypothetical protein [Pseudactinotalea suaedae]
MSPHDGRAPWDGVPLPYGAVDGQAPAAGRPAASSWDPLAPPSTAGGPWHPGEAAVFRPNRFLTVAMAIASAVLVVMILAARSGPSWLAILYGVLLAIALAVLVETLYGQVRVDPSGITRRSLRGTTTYLREELETPVLHSYVRRTRTGRQHVRRLSIRRRRRRYGFMITSDLYAYAEVEQIARRVGAARPSTTRGADIEASYPGATLWAHRHPVLLGVLIAVAVWLGASVYVTWALP